MKRPEQHLFIEVIFDIYWPDIVEGVCYFWLWLVLFLVEYQGLRREVRALRAETHFLTERLSQHPCDATGTAISVKAITFLPPVNMELC